MGHPDDDALEAALAECVAAFSTEGRDGLEAVLVAHPDLADVLRGRVEELVRLGLVSGAESSESADPFNPPEVLGDFVRGRRLGGGGMGIVFEAEQRSLGRKVALKMIRPDRLHLDSARLRFRTEVETIARLKHPAIVPVYSVGEEQGFPFFAMELVDGRTLEQAIDSLLAERVTRLSGADLYRVLGGGDDDPPAIFAGTWEETCIRVILEVAGGLRYAHEQGVLHRDLKPSNILLTEEGRVLMFDFGLTVTSRSTRITQDNTLLGSPAYMASELLRQESATVASEVYALGVTLYEMLALEMPFLGRSISELQEQIERGDVVPLRHRNRHLSWEIETVCLTAMDRDKGRRYPSVSEFAADLNRVLRREPIRARPPGPMLRAKRWCQRRPTTAVAAALGTVLLVGGPTTLWLQQRSANVVIAAQKSRADQNLQTALGAVDFFVLEMGGERLQSTPHMDAFSRPFLEKAVAFYEELLASDEQSTDSATGKRLAETHRRLAWLLKKLGRHDAAAAAAREAVLRARDRFDAGDPGAREVLARSLLILGTLVRDEPTENARGIFAEAGTHAESLLQHDRVRALSILVEVHRMSAWLHSDRADFDAAEKAHRAALRCMAELERESGSAYTRAAAARTKRDLAVLLDKRGRIEQARKLIEQSRAELTALVEDQPDDPTHQLDLADCLEKLSGYSLTTPKLAVVLQAEAVERLRKLVSDYPTVLNYRRQLAVDLDQMGERQAGVGDSAAEVAALLEARRHFEWLHERKFDGGHRFLFESAANLRSLALFESRRDDHAKAAEWAEKAVALVERSMRGDPGRAQHRYQLSKLHGALAMARTGTKEYVAAAKAYRSALSILRDLTTKVPDQQYYQKALAQTLNNFGMVQGETGDVDGAIRTYSEAVGIYRALAAADPTDAHRQHALAGGLYNLAHYRSQKDDIEQVLPVLHEARDWSTRAVRGNPRRRSYAMRLENTLWELGMVAARAGDSTELEKHAAAMVEPNPRRHSCWLSAAHLLATALPELQDPTARRQMRDAAMGYLRELVERGQHSPDLLEKYRGLSNLEGAADYAATMAKLNR